LSREVAYAIETYVTARKLGFQHPNLGPYVDIALGHLAQWADTATVPYVQPFMVALTAEALIEYAQETPDPRLLPALRAALEVVWTRTWVPEAWAFRYVDRPVPAEGAPEPAPDLNLLIAPAFAWVYRETGDDVARQRADIAFGAGVQRAWLEGGKQFSQNYRWSFDYVTWRSKPGGVSRP
jgi:hypothetical protein